MWVARIFKQGYFLPVYQGLFIGGCWKPDRETDIEFIEFMSMNLEIEIIIWKKIQWSYSFLCILYCSTYTYNFNLISLSASIYIVESKFDFITFHKTKWMSFKFISIIAPLQTVTKLVLVHCLHIKINQLFYSFI